MGFFDLLVFSASLASPTLAGFGLAMASPPRPNFLAAKTCLWVSTVVFWVVGVTLGMKSGYSPEMRISICAIMGAVSAIFLLLCLRLVLVRQRDWSARDSGLFANLQKHTSIITYPESGHVFAIAISGSEFATAGGGWSAGAGKPGARQFMPADPIYLCKLYNFSKEPMFEVTIPMRQILKREVLLESSRPGDVALDQTWPVKIPKIEPGNANPFSFYTFNMSPYFGEVIFPEFFDWKDMEGNTKRGKLIRGDKQSVFFSPAG